MAEMKHGGAARQTMRSMAGRPASTIHALACALTTLVTSMVSMTGMTKRATWRATSRMAKCFGMWVALPLGVTLFAACASQAPAGSVARFDLGPPAPVASHAGAPMRAPLKIVVTASNWLDADSMFYRLPSAQGDQARAYANSRWLASPVKLFGDRLRAGLAAGRPVIAAGDPADAATLRIEVDEFAQYFDGASSSHGVVQVRATLFDGTRLLDQATLRAQAPAPTPDAAGGARALAQASDEVQSLLIGWLVAHGH